MKPSTAPRPRSARALIGLGLLLPLAAACGGAATDGSGPDLAGSGGEAEAEPVAPGRGSDVETLAYDFPRIFKPAKDGDVALLEAILDEGDDPNQPHEGLYALHAAAGGGHAEAVRLLLGAGADPNVKQAAGATPLHIAVFEGHRSVVELLVEGKADLDATDNEGSTPLHTLVFSRMSAEDRVAVGELLIAKGANVDAQGQADITPLCAAIAYDKPELVKLFIDREANVELTYLNQNRAIHLACAKPNMDAVRLLLGAGADINAKNAMGDDPINIALQTDNQELVDLLRENGALQ